MRRSIFIMVILAMMTSSMPAAPGAADIIFVNGNFYTVSESQPRARAVAVRDGRIVFVGADRGALALKGDRTRVIDLHGLTVVPGFTDAHCHLLGIGERELTLNLEGTGTLEEFLARVADRVRRTPAGQWVTGRGWIETFWKPAAFPTRAELDRIAPDNPVFLTRADGHAAAVNSIALKLAGIDRNTPDPFGGRILKDRATGEPSGMLIDSAQNLVSGKIPPMTKEEKEKALLAGVKRSIELGWCELQIAGNDSGEIQLLRKLYSEGRIRLRLYDAVQAPGRDAEQLIEKGPGAPEFDGRFTVRAIKVLFDGALGSRGAALINPYSDSDTSGFLTQKEEELLPLFVSALRKGVQVETHAIGDLANRWILDLYEKAFAAVPPDQRAVREPRWRVEHAQIVSPWDIPRFSRLGVIPSMQPSHAIGDLHFAPARLGLARLAGAYAWRSFIDSGSIVPGGSDAPVERGDPMIEFYAAVARRDLKGFSGEGWHPEQAVTREQALKMLTLWPAYAAFEEKQKGSIEAGKWADFTVLSADIMTVPEQEIPRSRALMTVIAGEVVFEARH